MVEQKSSKSEDGKGVPSAAENKTAETHTGDRRLFPGGSPEAAKTHIGVNGVDNGERWIDDAVIGGTKSTS